MDAAGGGFEREYRRRRSLPWQHLGLVALVGVNAFFHASRPHYSASSRSAPWVVAVAMTVAVTRVLLEQYRGYTRVTGTGITAQGALRSRVWAWHEVYDIRVEHARRSGDAAPRWLAYLYDFEGRRFPLPHMDDRQLADPYAEVSALCLAAAPHRALSWERRPRVEELIRRRAGRRKGWAWGLNGALLVLLAMFMVDLWQIGVGRPEHFFLELVCVPLASFALLGALFSWHWSTRPLRPTT